ncbi:uncharacterized protein LOC62_07G009744 [Vanrija pseudolonga]|uniref:F-box domain-containing protein n=1 Tax=Vanrija pseudolonga TaxID=143232 RepID=A0AAF0YGC7_9TREE|nr:hypothetical protein LOC62_07G009744 [Vanrija pseudolonga]
MDDIHPPRAPSPTPPGLTSLPTSVLVRICDHLPGREVWHLRTSCKALRALLAPIFLKEHRRVYIMANAKGLDFLAAVAAGPHAKHVRLVVISTWVSDPIYIRSQEQRSFIGLGSPSITPVVEDVQPGLDVPFIRQLAAAFSRLPGLEMVKMTDYVWGQNPDGTHLPYDDPGGVDTASAIFRGLILALAHAHSADTLARKLKVADCKAFSDRALVLSAAERLVAAPFLGQLEALDFEFYYSGSADSEVFSSFISLCTGLVDLRLTLARASDRGWVSSLRLRLPEGPVALPCLKVLQLRSLILPADDLIRFLSQCRLREVDLNEVCLTAHRQLLDRYRNKCEKWIGHPALWDAVLRAMSNHCERQTRVLRLSRLSETMVSGNLQFVVDNGATMSLIVRADETGAAFPTTPVNAYSVATETDKEDVYIRAAEAIKTPPRSIPWPPDEPTTEPPLAHLPTEILHVICGFLDVKTVGNMRRCCLSLDTALIPCFGRYLSTVTIVPTEAGVDRLGDIASSPFGPYVRHVVVTGHVSQGEYYPTGVEHRIFLGLDADEEAGSDDGESDGDSESDGDGESDGDSESAGDSEWDGDEQELNNGFDSPFARQLGMMLSALPELQVVSLGAERDTSTWDSDLGQYRIHPGRRRRPPDEYIWVASVL